MNDYYSYDAFFEGAAVSIHKEKIEFLRGLGITDKASWKKWCLTNHPDKAKNSDEKTKLIAKVNEAVDVLVDAGVF